MSKRQLIILFGALIILIALFSGLPAVWNTILYVIIGALIIAVAYTTRPSQGAAKKPANAPYVDARGVASPAPAFRPSAEKLPEAPVVSAQPADAQPLPASSDEPVVPPAQQ